MATITLAVNVSPGYDSSRFPAFGVTAEVGILTMADGVLHLLLVRTVGSVITATIRISPGGDR